MATGACASRPVIALAFAMPRLLFLRDARLDLFFEPVPIQTLQKVFQLALFLLAKILQADEQPLRSDLRIPVRLLQALLQVLQNHIGITRCPQRISSLLDTTIDALERLRPATRLKSIQRGAQAARRYTHPMHSLD